MAGGIRDSEIRIIARLLSEGDYAKAIAELKAMQAEAKATNAEFSNLGRETGNLRTETERLNPSLANLRSRFRESQADVAAYKAQLVQAGFSMKEAEAGATALQRRLSSRIAADATRDMTDFRLAAGMTRAEMTSMLSTLGASAGAMGAVATSSGGLKAGLAGVLTQLVAISGWGKGAAIPFIGFQLAGVGTAAGMAGLSMEHLITTAGGLAASFIGAAIGAGELAAGMAAIQGTGMAVDMLVMKSTIADTKQLEKLYSNLSNAVLIYGAGSKQATDAQQKLNEQMLILGNTAGVQAELQLAKNAKALDQYWDKASSGARLQAVAILTQVLDLARDYIPRVTSAAQANLAVINTGLKPLFDWLKHEGADTFGYLEAIFIHNLPSAVHAFDQGMELLIKSLAVAATFTGGLIQKLDILLTYFNSTEGFQKWSTEMIHLIGLFHVWWDLITAVGRLLYDIFKNTVGLGASIVTTLTGMVQRLDDYVNSASGKQALQSVFETHKQEVLALLALIPPLLAAIGPIYLKLSPVLTELVVKFLTLTLAVINFLTHLGGGVGTLNTYIIGFLLLSTRFTGIYSLLGLMGTGFVNMLKLIKDLSIANKELTVTQWLLNAAQAAMPILLIILGIIALIAIIVLLITHWKQVTAALMVAWNWLIQVGNKHAWLQIIVALIFGPLALLVWHWQQVVAVVKDVIDWFAHTGDRFSALGSTVDAVARGIGDAFSRMGSAIHDHLAGAAHAIENFDRMVDDIPVIGGAINLPRTLPGFARGGIVDRPTAGVFGEAGPEMLLPLGRGAGWGAAVELWQKAGKILGLGGNDCLQCLEWVANTSGLFRGIDMASHLTPFINSRTPFPGEVFVSTMPPFGHTGYVTGPNSVRDANWVPCTVADHALSDIPNIVGYINLGDKDLGLLSGVVRALGAGVFDLKSMLSSLVGRAVSGIGGIDGGIASAILQRFVGSGVHFGPYTLDHGGYWPTGTVGLNTSGRTEYVASGASMEALLAELKRTNMLLSKIAGQPMLSTAHAQQRVG